MGASSGGGRSHSINISTPHPAAGSYSKIIVNPAPSFKGQPGFVGSGGSKNPASKTTKLKP